VNVRAGSSEGARLGAGDAVAGATEAALVEEAGAGTPDETGAYVNPGDAVELPHAARSATAMPPSNALDRMG
jgi:hypothetical protein